MKKLMILAASLVLSASAMAQPVGHDHRGHYNDRDNREVVVKEVRKVDNRGNVVVKEVHKVKVNDNRHHPRATHRFTNQELRHLRKHARYMSPREQRQHERMHMRGIRHDHRHGY